MDDYATTESEFELGETRSDSGLEPPVLDPEDFREELAEFGYTPEEEAELLELLWQIVRTAIDIRLGLHPMQMVLPAVAKFAREDAESALKETSSNEEE